MENKSLKIVLLVVVVLILGYAIFTTIKRSSLEENLILQQKAIIDLLKAKGTISSSVKEIITSSTQRDADLMDKISVSTIQKKQEDLDNRLAALEKKIDGVLKVIQQAQKGQPQAPKDDYTTVYKIPVEHTPLIGKKDAPVTLVEFLDFQCPFCARFHVPFVQAAKAYPDKVNYMIKNFPLRFHSKARSAAKAALAAGEQGKYAEMADLLLENGKSLSEEKYKELAKELGLDVEKFMKDYKEKDKVWEEYIKKDMALGANLKVRGTPTMFINGRRTRARNLTSFKKEIEEILKNKKM